MNIYYFYTKMQQANNKNDYNVFFSEIFELLGVKAIVCDTEKFSCLTEKDVLFIGEGEYGEYGTQLLEFCEKGGLLFVINSKGLDSLVGIERIGRIASESEFSVNGHLNFTADAQIADDYKKYALPVISDIYSCEIKADVKVLAISKEYGLPLITERKIGKGEALFFSFSLTQTIWYKTQGKPVYSDLDGCGFCRACDAMIVDHSDTQLIPTVDLYLRFIENRLYAKQDFVFLHQIPANIEGVPCDYIMHFCGDEDWCGAHIFEANNELKKRGVPYHVHLEPTLNKDFMISKDEYDKAKADGLKFGIHFDFRNDNSLYYDLDSLKAQYDLYIEEFGEEPGISNTHCFIYNGFGETLRWMDDLGIAGFLSYHCQPLDHRDMNKMNMYGFAFGTSYPTHTFEDYTKEHQRSNAIGMRVGFYEPRLEVFSDEEQIERYLNLVKDFALIGNIFIHPIYFVIDKKSVLSAVDKILDKSKESVCMILYTDEVAKWWHDRASSQVFYKDENTFETDFKRECVIKTAKDAICFVDGIEISSYTKWLMGEKRVLFTIPEGKHLITLKYL